MISPRSVHFVSPRAERRSALLDALREAGYDVVVSDAPSGAPDDAPVDLAIVDLAADARWSTVEDLVERGLTMLLVSGTDDMRRGFEIGAEECVLADAHPDEVVARCEAVLRRTPRRQGPAEDEPAVYADARLWVNFDSRQVWVEGRPAQLTPREFRLLRCLIRHTDETLSHDEILEAVWGRPSDGDRPTEVLKQYIWRLRQKVELDPDQPDTIVTDPGRGYRFVSHMG